jgi:hypothetical protein
MFRPSTLVLLTIALGAALAFTLAASAHASPPVLMAAKSAGSAPASGGSAGDASTAVRAGTNLGNIVKAWGSALLLGLAGLLGIAALAKRNVGEGLTLMALVVIIGGFLFADGAVKGFVQAIWNAVSGG